MDRRARLDQALQPKAIVPGHGLVMRDLAYLDTVRRMLVAAREQTLALVAKGLSGDSVAATVRLDSLCAEVAGEEKQMRILFSSFFRRPVIGRVYEEAKAGTLK